MNCIICGRFMRDNGILPDPENLEPEVVKSFYCAKDDWRQYEHQYFKGNLQSLETRTNQE